MNECCSHDMFVSPILEGDASECSVQGGESNQQPLGQRGVSEDDSSSSSSNEEENESEAIAVRSAPKPTQPSKAEMDEHMLSHLPFRSWCAHCVKGKSKSKRHPYAAHSSDHELPTVTIDYMFLNSESSSSDDGSMPTLVVKDILSPYCGTAAAKSSPVSCSSVQATATIAEFPRLTPPKTV